MPAFQVDHMTRPTMPMSAAAREETSANQRGKRKLSPLLPVNTNFLFAKRVFLVRACVEFSRH